MDAKQLVIFRVEKKKRRKEVKGAEFSAQRGHLGNQTLLTNGNHVSSIMAQWPHLPLAKVLSRAHLQ